MAFKKSLKNIIEFRNKLAYPLFGFKSQAKKDPDLTATIKMINAISHEWCGYTVKSERHRVGPKNQRSWKRTYWIDHRPYGNKPNKCGFGDKNTPILPPYKLAFTNEPEMVFKNISSY